MSLLIKSISFVVSLQEMGKWAKYGKKYCKEWEKDPELKLWVQSSLDQTKAFCRFCKCDIRAHKGDLLSHSKTDKHRKNAAPFSTARCKSLFDLGAKSITVDRSVKVLELKLASHIACHSSTSTIDHLGEIVKESKNISLHRTKCSALIKSAISPPIHDELINDLKKSRFSLIIDESTDVGQEKQLCIVVRYYSSLLKRIVTTFLGIISITHGNADGIFNALKSFLEKNGLDFMKCVGIATDGCNVMCGSHRSVITLIKDVNPRIIHIKCICHSIQLCSSYALKTLPRNIEFLVSETHNWFAHSTVRQSKYKDLYASIHPGEEPLKILKLSDTRWLSIAACVERILQQYDSLKLHFQKAKDDERCYKAELLYQMYSDIENKLYLVFLKPILSELNRVNKLFQLDRASPVRLLDELMTLYVNLLQRVMRPKSLVNWSTIHDYDIQNRIYHLPLNAVFYGIEFQLLAHDSNLEETIIERIKERCRNFVFELLNEMRTRLPSNVNQLESLSSLSPTVVLGESKPKFSELSFLSLRETDISVLEEQWNRIGLYSWPSTVDTHVEQFWTDVLNHEDASGEQDFFELGRFILSILSLPFSNASVERAFSQMNLIKSNIRNRMQEDMLESIMRIRSYMSRNDICCNTFEPTEKMLSLFTNDIYKTAS